ncbi:MRG-domain-containing protein [Abortiporus biennis]|nr:MRG-domain-containing protein [Abortiporus biennis]
MASSSSPIESYIINERVLCYHGPLIYEAKVLKVENWDETNAKIPGQGNVGPHYFVHYKGWKQTWDEWVHPSRLLKLNDTNIGLQKSLQQVNTASTAGAAGASKSHGHGHGHGSVSAAGGASANARRDSKDVGGRRKDARGVKRARDDDEVSKRPEMRLNVPEVLKVLLVDDWESVTKNNMLVPLPRTPSVVDILEEFKTYILKNPKETVFNLKDPSTLLPTVVSGLVTYFDRAIGANLLYRFERPQYAEMRRIYVTGQDVIIGQEKDMSQVYGAEHLLRMLVSLPQMVASSAMDAESITLVKEYVNELMAWMAKERERIFVSEYESASLAYQSVSRS